MKRFLLVILVIIMALVCTACKDEKNETSQTTPEKVETIYTTDAEELKKLSAEALELMSVLPEYDEGYPTVDDVANQYKMANMVVGWIVGTQTVATDPTDLCDYEGFMYERVRPDCFYGKERLEIGKDLGETTKLIYNMKTLESYLSTLIAPDEAKEYMIDITSYEMPKFIEMPNGALYAIPYSYPVLGYTDEETYALSDNGDGTYTFTVTYGYERQDGSVASKTEDFGYENIDGRWVLTDFYVIKQN